MTVVLAPSTPAACQSFNVNINNAPATATQVVVSYDAQPNQTAPLTNGRTTGTPPNFIAVGAGEQEVTATYLNAAGATVGTETETLTVTPGPLGQIVPPTLTVVAGNATGAGTTTLTCSATGSINGTVTYTVNGVVVGSATVTNGTVAATTFTIPVPVGTPIIVSFTPTSGTCSPCTFPPITVNVTGCTVTLEQVTKPAAEGQPVTFAATVLCNGSTPVEGATVTISGGGQSVSGLITDANGQVMGDLTFPTAGPVTVTATVTAEGTTCTCIGVTSPPVTVTVQPVCAVTLTQVTTPAIVGQPTTFSAEVTCGGAPLQGITVDFTSGTTTVTGVTDVNGVATGQITFTTAGGTTVTATANGPTGACVCMAQTSNTLDVTVETPCEVTLTQLSPIALVGFPIQFQATVFCGGLPVPGAAVVFSGGGVTTTATTDFAGQATVSLTFNTAGPVTVTASATSTSSNCACAGQLSNPINVSVQNLCSVVLAQPTSPVLTGAQVTLTATVTCDNTPVNGATVSFVDQNGNTLGTAASGPNGEATTTVTFATSGPVTVTAYATANGSGCFCSREPSNAVTFLVENVCSVALASPATPVIAGQPVSLQATVTCGGAPVTGAAVSFEDGAGNVLGAGVTGTNGVATASVTFATSGPVTVTAYATANGSGCICSREPSNAVTITVQSTCSVVVAPVSGPVAPGSQVSLSATVTCGGNTVSNAAVIFRDQNGNTIGSAITGPNGVATTTVTVSTTTSVTAFASVTGTACVCTEQPSVPIVITVQGTCLVVLTSVSGPVSPGQQVSLSATVTCGGTAVNGAGVVFRDQNGNILGSAATGPNGVATASVTFSTAGNVMVQAFATGTVAGCQCAETPSNVIIVGVHACSVVLSPVTTPPAPGQQVTLSATVTCDGTPLSGATVSFRDSNGLLLGTGTSGANGVATTTVAFATPGPVTVTAFATGTSANCVCSGQPSNSITIAVEPTCSVVLSSVSNPVPTGRQVTLTATVTCSCTVCTNTSVSGALVTFKDQNGNVLGTAATNASGVATTSVSFPAAGTVTVTAYATAPLSGCLCINQPSNPITIIVQAPCTVTLAPVTGPVIPGAQFALSATVLCGTTPVSGASVTFRDQNGNILGTAISGTNGVASTTAAVSSTGTVTVTAYATVSGTNCVCTNQPSNPVSIIVQSPCTVVLSSVSGPVSPGQQVNLSALVTCGGSPLFGALVTFKDQNGNVLGSASTNANGVAATTVSFATTGTVTVTAYATGNSAGCVCSNTQSNAISVIVQNACSVVLSPVSGPVAPGQQVTLSATVSCGTSLLQGATVTFKDQNGNVLGSGTTGANGVATATVSFPTTGTLSVTAYASANVAGCSCSNVASNAITVTVQNVCSVVLAAVNGPVNATEPVTLSATVTCNGSPVNGAAVTFRDAAGNILATAVSDSTGVASSPVTFTTAGPVTVTAFATATGGSCACTNQSSNPVAFTVVPGLSAHPACWKVNLPIPFPFPFTSLLIASLTPAQAGVNVDFYVGSRLVGSATTNAAGVAQLQAGLTPVDITHTFYTAIATVGTTVLHATGLLLPCIPPV